MRTTLTLDDDVAAALERLRAERDESFKQAVNEAIRAGMQVLGKRSTAPEPPRTRSFDAGEPSLPNVDNYAEALAYAEGENFK